MKEITFPSKFEDLLDEKLGYVHFLDANFVPFKTS